MIKWLTHCLLGLAWLIFPMTGMAAETDVQATATGTAQLVTAQNGVGPNAGTLSAALIVTMEPGWKTYWRSPGEVGMPPRLDWEGSENLADADMFWPAPKRFTAFGIENFGYEKRVVFPLQIELEKPGEQVALQVRVELLVCSEVCVPEIFELDLSLPAKAGQDAVAGKVISDALAKVPLEGQADWITSLSAFTDTDRTELIVTAKALTPFDTPDLFPELGAGNALGKPDIRLSNGNRDLWARFPIQSVNSETWGPLAVTVTDQSSPAFTQSPTILKAPPAAPFDLIASDVTITTLMWFAAVAVLGGFILNVMPCVLPVLSIKFSSALKSAGKANSEIRASFLATAGGVMAFMWLLAAVLVGLKTTGAVIGWGIQFQNPAFLAVMITVLLAFAGNLFGVFEIALPSGLQTRLSVVGGSSRAGDVATGFFAAMLATPCSAPFLGTAVAFALAGRGVDVFIIFTALGVGLAAPYLIVAVRPSLAAALPKPGRWMLWIKWTMGLLLLATVLWLAWVMVGVANLTAAVGTVLAGLALVGVLALGIRHPARSATAALALVVGTAVGATYVATPSQRVIASTNKLPWVEFDRVAIARHVSRGQTVFVDVTADWCVTCKANKTLVLEREPVASALKATNVVLMQADWTQPSDVISRYLEDNGRYGIPFNVVYGPGAPEGIILPEILRPGIILDALEDAKPSELRARLQNLARE